MASYYAWSPIQTEPDEKGKMQTIKLGESVSASDLDLTDEEFQYYIDNKVVREQPYPESLVDSVTPPSEYFKDLLAGAAEGSLTKEQTDELAKMNLGFDDSSSSKLAPSSEVEDVSGQTSTSKASTASKSS